MTARKCIAPLVFCTLFFATAAWANGYDDALRHVKNAQAFLDAKDYREALRELDDAADWNSGYGYYAYIRYLSGKAHAALGDRKTAEAHFREALKEAPGVNYQFVDPAYQVPEAEIEALIKSSGAAPPRRAPAQPVPAFYFSAEGKSAEIYSNIVFQFGHQTQKPCEFPSSPKLTKSLDFTPGPEPTPAVSLAAQDVENLVAPFCKNRLNFEVFAHGPGWVKAIALDTLQAQAEPSFCGEEDRNFRILAGTDSLPGEPLFFTTKKSASNDNRFKSSADLKMDSAPLAEAFPGTAFALPRGFSQIVKADVFDDPGGKAKTRLVHIVARGGISYRDESYGKDGEGIWNGFFAVSRGRAELLLETHESEYCGFDELTFLGALDHDGDGDMDLLVRSTRQTTLLDRHALGFRPIHWGLKPCTC